METATSAQGFVDAMDEMEPTLQNILDQRSLKWIFVGGKGGVGKTTCSCSLAVQLAAVRDRVLIISTDPAHNLSDAFRQTFNRNPTLVNGFTNLFAMEVDPAPAQEDLDSLEQAGGSFISDLAGSIPGIDEAMSFAEVMKQVQTMDYECIVFDTAPTGHTLRLLQFPATLEKGLAKVMSLKGSFQGMFSQFSTLMGLGEENSLDAIMGKLTQLQEVVQMVQQQFQDPDLTTFVCVCIPEFLSLYETERLVQELARYEIDSRNIVINQVVFGDVGGSKLFSARVRMQQKYIQQFYDLYEDFHIVKLPLLEEEVRGSDALRAFSVNLLSPYQPPQLPASHGRDAAQDRRGSEALQDENAALKARIAALEGELAALKAAAQ